MNPEATCAGLGRMAPAQGLAHPPQGRDPSGQFTSPGLEREENPVQKIYFFHEGWGSFGPWGGGLSASDETVTRSALYTHSTAWPPLVLLTLGPRQSTLPGVEVPSRFPAEWAGTGPTSELGPDSCRLCVPPSIPPYLPISCHPPTGAAWKEVILFC